jgi:hypothetical protein
MSGEGGQGEKAEGREETGFQLLHEGIMPEIWRESNQETPVFDATSGSGAPAAGSHILGRMETPPDLLRVL